MEASDAGSIRSGFSETSSGGNATERLHRRHAFGSKEEEDDLLEQKKTLQEAIFTCMYTLARSKTADSRAYVAAKILLEGLVPFLVVFNPHHWPLHTGNPVWQALRWVQPVTPVAQVWGYKVYIRIYYVLVALIYSVVIAIVALTLAMRRQDTSKWLHRSATLVQKFTDALFGMMYVAVFDYFLFLFNCRFGKPGNPHNVWSDVQCLSGAHAVHLAVGAVTGTVFFLVTVLMLVASCDLNPAARGALASPAAVTRLVVLCLKASYVICADTLVSTGKVQAVLMLSSAALIFYANFRTLPFLRLFINDLWVGVWTAVTYLCAVHMVMDLKNGDQDYTYVMIVLYGTFPAFLMGAAAAAVWSRLRLRPASKFHGLQPADALALKVHKFSSQEEVEYLSRAMRNFDSDGLVREEAAQLGETIIKCGLAAFPNDVGLMVLYANFLLNVRRDGPAARTQLQLALKAGPSIVQRYGIFSTIENSKRLKDGQEGSLDLQSYVEFKRNFRAVVRVHKVALAAQREFWVLMQRPAVKTRAVEAAMAAMEAAANAAHQVYRRVLERYPHNGKLLRCYGKFLEDVRNDPLSATRAYTEAARNGGGDGLLSLDLQIQGSGKPEFLTSMDLHEDACVIINAEGKILVVNSCVGELLGYSRAELEGANVSTIMPQPFAGRHAGYLNRYAQGGEPHILDTVRDVVALHKDRYVFPLQLCVTKLSGVGNDAVFLGLLRPALFDARNVRAWVAPNGTILCTDPQFASLTGMLGEDMVGHNFRTLLTDMAAVDSLLELCKAMPYDKLVAGEVTAKLEIAHKYLPPVPVEIKVTPGGTDAQRIFVFNAHRTDLNKDGLMVVDPKGSLTFATWDVAAMLGYPLRSFLRMRLEQLLPQPFATMHAKHLKRPLPTIPPISCRAGRVVNMINVSGAHVAVRLRVTSKDDDMARAGSQTRHVVQVSKVDTSSSSSSRMYDDQRICLLCTMDGKILSVDQPTSGLFGFTASGLVGSNLADCIDVFGEWRTKAGAHQLELLLLGLLDKEAEMPGTSWRVKVHSPEAENPVPGNGAGVDLRAVSHRASGHSACLQTEILDLAEGGLGSDAGTTTTKSYAEADEPPEAAESTAGLEGGSMTLARVILWRRDLLTGVVELDERLTIRKADVSTGLIVGLPPSALQRMPLHKLLDISKGMTWDELTASDPSKKKNKSALRNGSGSMLVSEPKAFIGPHPDGGSMKVILQGVSGGPGGRINATLHPDTAFVGARANVYRALGLDVIISHQRQQPHQGNPQHPESRPAQSVQHTHAPKEAEQLQQPRCARQTHGASMQLGVASQDGAPPEREPSRLKLPTANCQLPTLETVEEPQRLRLSALPQTGRPQSGGPSGSGVADGRRRRGSPSSSSSPSSPSSSSSSDSDGSNSSHIRRLRTKQLQGPTSSSSGSSSSSSSGSRQGSAGGGRGGAAAPELDARRGSMAEDQAEGARMHSRVHNQSEFISQWVRSLSRQMTAAADRQSVANSKATSRKALLAEGGGGVCRPISRPAGLNDDVTALLVRASTQLLASGLVERPRSLKAAEASDDGANGLESPVDPLSLQPLPSSGRFAHGDDDESDKGLGKAAGVMRHEGKGELEAVGRGGDKDTPRVLTRGGSEANVPLLSRSQGASKPPGKEDNDSDYGLPFGGGAAGGGAGGGGGSSVGDDDDEGSQGPAATSQSGITSEVDLDISADARKARLLRRLVRIMYGPSLAVPLARLFRNTLLLLLGMLVSHVVCYVILMSLINDQYGHVHSLHRTALAADRSQVATIKAAVADFCSGPGLAPVGVCEPPLDATLADLRASLEDLESYHQNTYLGVSQVPKRLTEPTLYAMWTQPRVDYRMYLDVEPPRWANLTSGVWKLGNRFIATGRELLYWGQRLSGHISHLRAYQFVLANGPWALFNSYTLSLEYIAKKAWEDVLLLERSLLILVLVEAAVVQLACILYEWWLVWRVELGRRGEMLVALGLPGPILRIMASRPLVVVEDSDEEENTEEGDGPADIGHAASVDAGGPSRHSVDEPAAHAVASAAAAQTCNSLEYHQGGGGAVRSSLDHLRAVHTLYQRTGRASIDFAPLRGSAQLGGEGFDMLYNMPYHNLRHPRGRPADFPAAAGAVRTTYHRTGRASIDFAPIRGGPAGQDIGLGGFGAGFSSGVMELQQPPVQLSAPPPAAALPAAELVVSPPREWRRLPAPILMAVEVKRLGPEGEPAEDEAAAKRDEQRTAAPSVVSGAPLLYIPMSEAPVSNIPTSGDSSPCKGVVIGGKRGVMDVATEGRGRLTVNGKMLVSSPRHLLRFTAPLLLWEMALVVVAVLSYFWLDDIQGPLASLNMASHVIYRYTRVRMSALMLVAGNSIQERVEWRAILDSELANLRDEYETLLYGGVASTQAGSVFQRPVPASTFESTSFSRNFFKEERCFRWDQSKCYTPDSPYYEVTHQGLDVMMRRIISELALLVADDDADATYNGTRYTTVYHVGTKDLYEGLQSSAQLFVDFMISRYQKVKLLNTILLVCTIAVFLMYALVVLRPYRVAVEHEAVRLAGLLSHVPAEMDVAAHARQVLRAHGMAVGLLVEGGLRPGFIGMAATRGAQIRDGRRRGSEGGVSAAKVPLLGSGV